MELGHRRGGREVIAADTAPIAHCMTRYRSFAPRCPRKAQPERGIVLDILKELAYNGWRCGKVKVSGAVKKGGGFIFDPYTMRGLPDIFAFKNGVMLGVECKAGKNHQTPYQKEFQKLFHHPPDRIYVVARSYDDVGWALNFPQ
jgi:hypothetical protein